MASSSVSDLPVAAAASQTSPSYTALSLDFADLHALSVAKVALFQRSPGVFAQGILLVLYKHCAPDRIHKISAILERYRDQEFCAFGRVARKYGIDLCETFSGEGLDRVWQDIKKMVNG